MQQQLLRLDFEDDFAPLDHQRLHDQFSELLPSHDVIVLSDYAKGTLADAAGLITSAKARSLPVLVDPKGLDFGKYAGATLLTPNMQEFSAVASAFSSEEALVEAAISLRAELDLEHLLVTRGEKGMSLFSLKSGPVTIPAHAKEVYDVTGAGDTVIATLAAAIASSVPIVQAMNLANLAASIVVARKGTASVTAKELRALWSQDDDEGAVLAQIEAAKAARESIVMTNGCFDILHAGHVDYLSRARALGDRLVVAVNSDASVERLKGETRPINRLEDRMAVLRALRVVDWVVSFDGSYSSQGEHNDTPLDIITAIKPHILAKGGDYSVETIVGAQDVMEAGGRVEVLPFIDGLSTTNILSRI